MSKTKREEIAGGEQALALDLRLHHPLGRMARKQLHTGERTMKLKVLALIALLVACEAPAKPPPVKWGPPLTAAQCVAKCAPLGVASFRPNCSQQLSGSRWYYCGNIPTDSENVCSCGGISQCAPQQSAPEAPNLVAPVVVHHGLKYILSH